MSHITAILIVLTLTGSPVTGAVCAMLCGHSTARTAHCHETMSDAADVAITADGLCGTLVPDLPYVTEDVTSPQQAAVVSVHEVARPQPVAVPWQYTGGTTAAAWLAPPLILRR